MMASLHLFLFFALLICTDAAGPTPPDWWSTATAAGDLIVSTLLPSNNEYVSAVANGYLAAIPTGDTLYVSGLFNGEATSDPSHRARIPFQLGVKVKNAASSQLHALDVRRAAFYTLSEIKHVLTPAATVMQTWYAPRDKLHVIVLDVLVNATAAKKAVEVEFNVHNGTESDDIGLTPVDCGAGVDNCHCWLGSTKKAEEPGGSTQGVAVVTTAIPKSVTVDAGAVAKYHFVMAVRTTLDCDQASLLPTAVASYNDAMSDPDALFNEHQAAWSKLWESGIEVGGNLNLAYGINTSLYYILSSVHENWPYGLSPGSLATNAYNGHSFWDTETWMYPTTALMYQSLARSLLIYRTKRVHGAELKAKSYDPPYKGAMYPWESAYSGIECTPSWAATGVRELHIGADIVLAAQQYWNMTCDEDFTRGTLMPMIRDISEFWLSKVEHHPETDEYWITDVIPPDEYADHVNNSVYTNWAVAMAFEADAYLSVLLNKDTERANMLRAVAGKLRIPYDQELKIHPEFDGYKGEKIKQADVVLLGYPLQMPMSPQERKNDLKYYADRTDVNGPAMTHAMHTIAWISIDDLAEASLEFTKAHEKNQREPFYVWSETITGGAANFITGAGGFLQSVWAGYGGVRMREGSIYIRPQLPDKTNSLRLRGIQLLGRKVTVERTLAKIILTVDAPSSSSAQKLCAIGTQDPTSRPLDSSTPVVYDPSVETGIVITKC